MAQQAEAKQEEKGAGCYDVPDTKEKLYDFLLAGESFEISTFPLYLTAYFSFVDDDKLSDTAKAAKKLVIEVVMEEILHMNLVNNIIAAIYGVEKATASFNIKYGKGVSLPANIRDDVKDLSLKPFCKQALYDTFIQIESPTSLTDDHKPVKLEDGSIRYPYEPKDGEDSVTLTFRQKEPGNSMGEFYGVLKKALTDLSGKGVISFTSDDKGYKQAKCKSKTKEQDDITSLQDALDAIDLVYELGEGSELPEGTFTANNDEQVVDKTHFIYFVEALVGKQLISIKRVADTKDTITCKFTFDKTAKYKVDFDKDVYPMNNFTKPAPFDMFNKYYKETLEKVTAGLKVGNIDGTVEAMKGLQVRFKECMEKGVYPDFQIPDFPAPPLIKRK